MQEASSGSWDFASVIDLIQSLSTPQHEEPSEAATIVSPPQSRTELKIESPSLGDFAEIWTQAGLWNGQPAQGPCVKGVRWKDELDGAALAADDEASELDMFKGFTKQQRKKARRKARRQALAESLTNGNTKPESSDDDDAEGDAPKILDRKALIYDLLDRPLPTNGGLEKSINGTVKQDTKGGAGKAVSSNVALLNTRGADVSLAAAVAKKAKILSMLRERYIEERPYLVNAGMLQNIAQNKTPGINEGIHIFVDASNIMIGFHDALKLARSLPLATRLKRQPISFHALSLILARGRPTAKAVVVGSDNFPEMEEARLIGYETSVLERVQKAKELKPRQKRFAGRENGAMSAGSGSETTAAIAHHSPVKWVEQAVDELLHLKMMESIVDAAEPATMVLATGDAAEAEFSSGFLKMVERALGKGWKVELACWKHNMSAAYTKRNFRERWKHSFKVVELDDFVEYILGTN